MRISGRLSGIVFAAVILIFAARAEAAQKPVVVGYVFPQNTTLTAGQVDAQRMTRINYAFANIAQGRMVEGFAQDAANLATLTALRKENPSLTVLVSVGGWLWSGGFSDVALTAESRRVFIDSVMEYLAKYDLDGLDIDWEYPGMTGAGHAFRSEDGHNFTLLLGELRERFDTEEKLRGRHLYLTIAAGASAEFLQHTEMAQVARLVDTVNLMCYDYYEPGSSAVAGHHAPLFTNSADPEKISADASVRAFEQAGVPAGKIVLGVPFYGHVWGQVSATRHGLYQRGKPAPEGYAPYHVIESTMLNHGYGRYWDSVAQAPYLYNSAQRVFVSYEDPQSIAAKGRYVLARGLGGMMFWSYEDDGDGVLLKAVDSALGLGAAR